MVCCEALDTGMKEDKDSIQYNVPDLPKWAHVACTYEDECMYVKTVKVKITEHLDFL